MSLFKDDPGSDSYFESISTRDHKWLFLKEPITVSVLTLKLPLIDCRMYEGGAADTEGDISCQFETLTFLANDLVLSGHIESTFEFFNFEGQAHTDSVEGSIDVSFDPFALQMQAGLNFVCTFEPMEFVSSYTITGEIMDNCVFEKLKFFGVGTNTYVSLSAEMAKMDCFFGSGSELLLSLERFDFNGNAISGFNGDINLQFKNLRLDAVGGPASGMVLDFKVMDFVAVGDNPILCNIITNFSNMSAVFSGYNELLASMDLNMPLFQCDMEGVVGIVGNIKATMEAHYLDMYSNVVNSSHLNVNFRKLSTKMNSSVNGPNSIDLIMPKLNINIVTDNGDCDTAVNLEFEEA